MDSIRDEPSLHPIKQKPHPQTSPFTPHSGNPSREQQNRAQGWGTGQGQPGASGAQGPGFCCPILWDCPVQSQELAWILVLLSHWGYSRIAPGLLSPCSPSRNCWSGLAQSTSWAQPGCPALGRSLSCHSGQRDEAGLGLPFLIHLGYPHVRPLLAELC